MISLLIIIPLYWLAFMAILDALNKPAKLCNSIIVETAIESIEPKEIAASLVIVEPQKPSRTLELPAAMPIMALPAPVIIDIESVSIDSTVATLTSYYTWPIAWTEDNTQYVNTDGLKTHVIIKTEVGYINTSTLTITTIEMPQPEWLEIEKVPAKVDDIPAYKPLKYNPPDVNKEIDKPLQPSVFIPLDFELKVATGNVINIRGKLCK